MQHSTPALFLEEKLFIFFKAILENLVDHQTHHADAANQDEYGYYQNWPGHSDQSGFLGCSLIDISQDAESTQATDS